MRLFQLVSLSALLSVAFARHTSGCLTKTTVIDFETLRRFQTPSRLPDGTRIDGRLNQGGGHNDLIVYDSGRGDGGFHSTEGLVVALEAPVHYKNTGGTIFLRFPEEVDVTFIRFLDAGKKKIKIVGKDSSKKIVAKEKIKGARKGFTDVRKRFRGVKSLVIKQKTLGALARIEYSCRGKSVIVDLSSQSITFLHCYCNLGGASSIATCTSGSQLLPNGGCKKCPPGKFSTGGKKCRKCPVGTFSAWPGEHFCRPW